MTHTGYDQDFVASFIVPEEALPLGCDTLPSFIAKKCPKEIDLMDGADGNMTAYADQEAKLTDASGILGLPVHEVPAAQFWRERGVLRQKAFDVRLLQVLCPLL